MNEMHAPPASGDPIFSNQNVVLPSFLTDRAGLLEQAASIAALAVRSDAMCLKAALKLGAAVPDLLTLSQRFEALSSLLIEGESLAATGRLETVASEIVLIGSGLAIERETLLNLISLNHVLSIRIEEIARNIRFLVSVVANVKIEIACIGTTDLRLAGFVDNLKQLTDQSQDILETFQSTQNRLIKQLRDALKALSLFESTHQARLLAAAAEIQTILEALSGRRKVVARLAEEIGGMTRRIGTQIGHSIVALQVGDSTRQRLEHVDEALVLAASLDEGAVPEAVGPADDDRRCTLITQIMTIQSQQLESVVAEFPVEIRTIEALLQGIIEACQALLGTSDDLCASSAGDARSYIVELDRKLAFTHDLINQSGQSRKVVDEAAEHVVASVAELEALAKHVATMAIDMTIIGTNAMVTSYRFGSRGAALSVIAQHLRSHALLVADEVTRIQPILVDVLQSGDRFASGRRRQNASSMGQMAACMTESLGVFRNADASVSEIRDKLRLDVTSVAEMLEETLGAFGDIGDVQSALTVSAALTATWASEVNGLDDRYDAVLEHLLRRRYTMQSEREVFDHFATEHGGTITAAPTLVADAIDDFML